ncbi:MULTISPECIES: hypothetical protein [unclassified Bradyrhizobium]|uniref:hypothetical protein n=1 Tax=Bradyrhizobium sp. USDA 4541 TaxID=2817704 RepID=UPI0020A2E8C8|nr:hypothetical protein [Bradyrhizobium sp. USDA 4541]MCP1852112.1 hypothetical protein [Bradyrhizobium sp. USDA 4541]
MTTVRKPPTPLSESNGTFGHQVETPRARSTSVGTFGHQVEQPAIPMTNTVNGVTHIVSPGANEPK